MSLNSRESSSGRAVTRPNLTNFRHPRETSVEVTDQLKQLKLLGEELVVFRDANGVVAMTYMDRECASELSEVVLDQDRMIIESHRPELIPVDLREKLRLKVPDATGIAYRRILGAIEGINVFMP
jgi:phenylpropionate dioxygenase-like ring-hydroxylating dioxygenase large terminal subunit